MLSSGASHAVVQWLVVAYESSVACTWSSSCMVSGFSRDRSHEVSWGLLQPMNTYQAAWEATRPQEKWELILFILLDPGTLDQKKCWSGMTDTLRSAALKYTLNIYYSKTQK